MVRLGDLCYEDKDGGDVPGGGQAAKQSADQHHGEVLQGTNKNMREFRNSECQSDVVWGQFSSMVWERMLYSWFYW